MSEASLAYRLECLDGQGQGVRVEFQKQGDRFGHTIFAVRDGQPVPQLTSIEGPPDQIAPPNPPFAELHQQDELLFLSGATTLGHWSMSVQAVDGRLLFEVACRLMKEADWLGSTYRVVADNTLLEPGDATQSTLQQSRLLVAPSLQKDARFPTTFQWCYSVTGVCC